MREQHKDNPVDQEPALAETPETIAELLQHTIERDPSLGDCCDVTVMRRDNQLALVTGSGQRFIFVVCGGVSVCPDCHGEGWITNDCPRCLGTGKRSRQGAKAARKRKEAERERDRRIADHVDGFDRDDLGESPDY